MLVLQPGGGQLQGMPRGSAQQLPLPATAPEAPAAPCVQAAAAGHCSFLARLHGGAKHVSGHGNHLGLPLISAVST